MNCKICKVEISKDRGYTNLLCLDCKRENNKKYLRSYHQSKKGKLAVLKATLKASVKHKDKWIARSELRKAVRNGNVIKQPCWCGNPKSQGHHPDYSKPLEVIWLCSKHHSQKHH